MCVSVAEGRPGGLAKLLIRHGANLCDGEECNGCSFVFFCFFVLYFFIFFNIFSTDFIDRFIDRGNFFIYS